MAFRTYTTDALTVSPPLTPHEQRHLQDLCWDAPGPTRRPGLHSPWEPAEGGVALRMAEEFGTAQPLAEWAAYLSSHLLGPNGPRLLGKVLEGFTYDHTITGTVHVEGRAKGDRWTLVADGSGVAVERTQMPCASCWAEALLAVRPTQAYRFLHPVRAANLTDGTFPDFDHDGMEAECLSRTWVPVGPTRVEVVWPPPPRWSVLDWWIDPDRTPDAVPFRWGGDPADEWLGQVVEGDQGAHLQAAGERRLGDILGASRPGMATGGIG